jgi:hypothetical protein
MDSSSQSLDFQATSSKTKPKKLIPWRDQAKGYTLRVALFKLALIERVYFKSSEDKRKVDERWQNFAVLLFKQPEFEGTEGSWRSIRDQFDATLKDRAKHHGWMDENGGVTANLSNHAGDLDELDQRIKDCLMDKEKLEAEKELQRNLSSELNARESELIQGQLSHEAKEHRRKSLKHKISPLSPLADTSSSHNSSSGGGTSARVSSSEDRLLNFLFNIETNDQAKRQRIDQPTTSVRSNKERETDLIWKLQLIPGTLDQLITEASLTSERSTYETLSNIGMDLIVSSFCLNGEGCELNANAFKAEMERYGLPALDAAKLCVFLRKLSDKSMEDWKKERGIVMLDDILLS